MSRPLSVGVLHPTFESWGGAEWFIHGLLNTWASRGEVRAVLYTYRWTDPPGETARYHVVAHGRGGVLSGPWDWIAIGRHLEPHWKEHDVLFFHNYPAGEWVRCSHGNPALVWYCHEPPRFLWDTQSEPSTLGSVPSTDLESLRNLYRLGPHRALWRFSSHLRLVLTRRLVGTKEWENRLREWDRETVGATAAIIANSRFTAQRVNAIYGRESTVAYPLLPHFDPKLPLKNVEKDRIVLWVGRLAPEKRPETMLRAWRKVVQETGAERLRLVFVGDGPLRSPIEEQLTPLVASGHAELRRNIPGPELRDLYRRALLTVHLGRNEPFGLVPLESLWEGTPVLADCEGGVRETVVPGETGFCLEDPSADTLASTLRELLSRPEDLADLGTKAASLVRERFSFGRTTEIIEQGLRNAVTPRAR